MLDMMIMDRLSPEKRSDVMSKIRGTGTKPELALHSIVKSALPRRKIEINFKSVSGSPDVYIPSLKLAIFAQGCFWHSCRKHGSRPSSNTEYWWPKLDSNAARDARIQRSLRQLGIGVWVVWEHDLQFQRIDTTTARLSRRLENRAEYMRGGH